MMKLILILFAFSSLSFAQCTGFTVSKAVVIDHTKVSNATLINQLPNFTVLVDKTDAAFADTGHSGNVVNVTSGIPEDLVFCDAANSALLNWEIESYDNTNGHIRAWVLIASVSALTDTTFHIAAGKSSITTFQGGSASASWDSDYLGIFHGGTSSTLSLTDSTGRNTAANGPTTQAATAATGQINGGFGLASASSQYVSLGGTSTLNPASGSPTTITISAWIKPTTNTAVSMIGSKFNNATPYGGWELYLGDGSVGKVSLQLFSANSTSNNSLFRTTNTAPTGSWTYVVGTADGSTSGHMHVYLNGTSETAATTVFNNSSGIVSSTSAAQIGTRPSSSSFYFNGAIDEFRVSQRMRGADWIKTEYNNQSSPDTFVSFGTCSFTSAAGYLNLGFVGQAYSFTATSYAGCSTPAFSITSGSLPSGLSLNTSTGVISGTPTGTGTSSFTLHLTDANSASADQSDQIKVGTVSGISLAGWSDVTVRGGWTTDESSDTKLSCTDGTSTWNTTVVNPIQSGSSAYWGVTGHSLSLIVYRPSGSLTCTGYSTYVNGGTGSVALGSTSVLTSLTTNPVKIANDASRTRYNMRWNGSIGSSGDIKFPTWAADGTVVVNSNDSFGKASSSSAYCCTGHVIEEKFNADMRSSVSMLGGTINSVTGNTPFGSITGDIGWTITGGSCSVSTATVNFVSQGWTPPVGTPVWVTGVTPSLFNVSNVAITASSATSISYPATCGVAYVSGGAVAVWNDSAHFLSVSTFSLGGSLYIMPYRGGSPVYQALLKSTDYWATSINNTHNTPTATPVTGWDVPLPSNTQYFPNGAIYYLHVIQPCQDYGGTGMTQFSCTWAAGTDARVYALRSAQISTSSGYQLWYMRPEDVPLMDGSKWYIYQGSQADTDTGIQESQWLPFSTANATSGTWFNSTSNAYGNGIQQVYLPAPFNRFVQIEWSSIRGTTQNISQSAGAILYDHGIYPWGTSVVMGSLNSDSADTKYFPTWSRCYNSTYSSISTSPPAAKIQCGMSGSYLSTGSGGGAANTNQYGPNNYELYLTARENGTAAITQFKNPTLVNPRFTYLGNGLRHIGNGLELYNDWTSCLTAGNVWKNLAPKPTANYDTNLTQTQTMLCDTLGLKSFGFPTQKSDWGLSGATPNVFVVSSGFTKSLTSDFTSILVFRHKDGDSTGVPSGECILSASDLAVCRNGTTANSWTFKVGSTTSSAQTLTTDGTNFALAALVRSGSTTSVYSSAGIPTSGALSALTTISDSSTISATRSLGGVSGGTKAFQGWLAYWLVWNRALNAEELRSEVGRLRNELSQAGGTIP